MLAAAPRRLCVGGGVGFAAAKAARLFDFMAGFLLQKEFTYCFKE